MLTSRSNDPRWILATSHHHRKWKSSILGVEQILLCDVCFASLLVRSIRNCRQFVVCVVCRQHQVVDWYLLVSMLDCLFRKRLGSVCMDSIVVSMVVDGYIA